MVLADGFKHFNEARVGRDRADQGEEEDESSDFVDFRLGELSFVGLQVEEAGEDESEKRACEGALEVDELAQIWNGVGDEAAHHGQTESYKDHLHPVVQAQPRLEDGLEHLVFLQEHEDGRHLQKEGAEEAHRVEQLDRPAQHARVQVHQHDLLRFVFVGSVRENADQADQEHREGHRFLQSRSEVLLRVFALVVHFQHHRVSLEHESSSSHEEGQVGSVPYFHLGDSLPSQSLYHVYIGCENKTQSC